MFSPICFTNFFHEIFSVWTLVQNSFFFSVKKVNNIFIPTYCDLIPKQRTKISYKRTWTSLNKKRHVKKFVNTLKNLWRKQREWNVEKMSNDWYNQWHDILSRILNLRIHFFFFSKLAVIFQFRRFRIRENMKCAHLMSKNTDTKTCEMTTFEFISIIK